MIRITVIWLSVKYQNFFTFQDVKYAYPPHTVNVPFISSHIKYQGRHKNRIYQHDSFTFHVGFSLWFIRSFCITMSEIELVFRWPGRRCSGSLFSMLLFKKLYLMQIFNQYLYIKRMIHVHFWIRIYRLELNNLFEGVKDVMNTRW